MLSKITNPVKAHDNQVVLLAASFSTSDASGAVGTVEGKGFSSATVTRVSQGRWRFVLPGTGGCNVLFAAANLREATPSDRFCKVALVTESTRTVEVVCWDVSALGVQDPASGDGISLFVVLKNSNLRS